MTVMASHSKVWWLCEFENPSTGLLYRVESRWLATPKFGGLVFGAMINQYMGVAPSILSRWYISKVSYRLLCFNMPKTKVHPDSQLSSLTGETIIRKAAGSSIFEWFLKTFCNLHELQMVAYLLKFKQNTTGRWWFQQFFFCFHSYLGNDPKLTIIFFQMGWIKPPTRNCIKLHHLHPVPHDSWGAQLYSLELGRSCTETHWKTGGPEVLPGYIDLCWWDADRTL